MELEESQYGELLPESIIDPNHTPKCLICRVDVPCLHQLDEMRMEGWLDGWRENRPDGDRTECYGLFLHDEDFDKFQPFCYIEPKSLNNPQWVDALYQTECELLRGYWIRARCCEYLGPEWQKWNNLIMDCYDRVILLQQLKLRF